MAAVDDLIASGFNGRELVFCTDGPRAGAWYFADWWTEQRRIADLTEEIARLCPEQAVGDSVLGYVPTRQMQPHPKNLARSGRVLRWDPKQAARAGASS